MEDNTNMGYAGDGVYLEDVKWAIAVRVSDHRNEPVVIFEQDVLQSIQQRYQFKPLNL